MLRVSPHIFDIVLSLIEHHPVFRNNSNHPQAPVEVQLVVTLYRTGRCGNGASIQDIARAAGCSEGSVENYTKGKIDSKRGRACHRWSQCRVIADYELKLVMSRNHDPRKSRLYFELGMPASNSECGERNESRKVVCRLKRTSLCGCGITHATAAEQGLG
jgi:hypothetical protein